MSDPHDHTEFRHREFESFLRARGSLPSGRPRAPTTPTQTLPLASSGALRLPEIPALPAIQTSFDTAGIHEAQQERTEIGVHTSAPISAPAVAGSSSGLQDVRNLLTVPVLPQGPPVVETTEQGAPSEITPATVEPSSDILHQYGGLGVPGSSQRKRGRDPESDVDPRSQTRPRLDLSAGRAGETAVLTTSPTNVTTIASSRGASASALTSRKGEVSAAQTAGETRSTGSGSSTDVRYFYLQRLNRWRALRLVDAL